MDHEQMDILEIMKRRATVRKYEDRPLPQELLDKIIEAGVWGPSVLGMQPWNFIVIQNADLISRIAQLLFDQSEQEERGVGGLLYSASKTIRSAPVVVSVYTDHGVIERGKRYKGRYFETIKNTEVQAIAGAIQNMMLAAYSVGVAGCWLDIPHLYASELKEIIPTDNDLVAILTFGYSSSSGLRSQRKPMEAFVKML